MEHKKVEISGATKKRIREEMGRSNRNRYFRNTEAGAKRIATKILEDEAQDGLGSAKSQRRTYDVLVARMDYIRAVNAEEDQRVAIRLDKPAIAEA